MTLGYTDIGYYNSFDLVNSLQFYTPPISSLQTYPSSIYTNPTGYFNMPAYNIPSIFRGGLGSLGYTYNPYDFTNLTGYHYMDPGFMSYTCPPPPTSLFSFLNLNTAVPAPPTTNIGYSSTPLFGFLTAPKRTQTHRSTASVTYPSCTTYSTYPSRSNLPSSLNEYNSRKGNLLAQQMETIRTGFDHYCARHVKEAIQMAGLGDYENGHAYQMGNILSKNKNFKEISVTNLSNLPAGCILVYDRGVSGYSSQYGHTEITMGNGTACSGGITHNIRPGARVFIPV